MALGRRHALLLGLALATTTLGTGCNRWQPNRPARLVFSDADTAFETAQVIVQRQGYEVAQLDPIHYYIRVKAKLDQPGERTSYFELQTYSDGQLHVVARGDHTRDGDKKAHRKLVAEMEALASALRAGGGIARVATR